MLWPPLISNMMSEFRPANGPGFIDRQFIISKAKVDLVEIKLVKKDSSRNHT